MYQSRPRPYHTHHFPKSLNTSHGPMRRQIWACLLLVQLQWSFLFNNHCLSAGFCALQAASPWSVLHVPSTLLIAQCPHQTANFCCPHAGAYCQDVFPETRAAFFALFPFGSNTPSPSNSGLWHAATGPGCIWHPSEGKEPQSLRTTYGLNCVPSIHLWSSKINLERLFYNYLVIKVILH
jgi:hypothetical protein